ncbi:MAG: RNA polymerase sigma factor [Bacteroidia bacterium]
MKAIQTRDVADSNQELALRLRARDPLALRELYDQYAPLLLGLIRAQIVDQHQAEDLLHVAFIKIWDRATSFDPEREKLIVWMIRIAREVAQKEKKPNFGGPAIQVPENSVDSSNAAVENKTSALDLILLQGMNLTDVATTLNLTKTAVQQQIRQEILNHRNKNSHV